MPKPPPLLPDLIRRYDKPGPRYTSYPPATEFHPDVGESDFRCWAQASNEELIPKPLSLYFHIPFCSSICFYCACNKIIDKRGDKAKPYLRDLHREIELRALLFDSDREVRQLHWGGGTPGFLTRQQAQELMTRIGTHFRLLQDGNTDYSIEVDPRVMKPGDVAFLRRLGFNRISIGVQDFDEQVQKAVNRLQSPESTELVINEARRHGFRSVNVDLIYGLPRQTRQSFAATLERIIELDPDRIALYNYAHLPSRFPAQRRIDADELPLPGDKLAILQQSVDRLCTAGYEYIGMDHFAKPVDELTLAQRNRSLQRNFQGYSAHAHCDSVGFGVSAISQVSDNFSQNCLRLDDYHDLLEQAKLPIVRGYRSNDDDLLRRDIIQSLVCHLQVDKRAVEKRWGIEFERHFARELSRLEELQRDGLIELGENAIVVQETGRLLVRNICMVFDRYQQRDRVTPLFSNTV